MKQPEQSLYPKLSSIYNKILQLASAILLIIVLMSMWQSSNINEQENLAEHFDYIAKQYILQASAGTGALLRQKYRSNSARNEALQDYLDGLIAVDFVKQVHLYDETGLLLLTSSAVQVPVESADKINTETKIQFNKSIVELYGIAPEQVDLSDIYIPFVKEIRDEKLRGYIRFTIEESHLIQALSQADDDRQTLFRLMLLLAGFAGFLLTRGLNRFSRHSYQVQIN